MILVRDIFQLKFGKAREAIAAWKEGTEFMKKVGLPPGRVCTDLTGAPYYTLVFESTYESLTAFEAAHAKAMGTSSYKEWRAWYERFIPLAESGRREIFNIVE